MAGTASRGKGQLEGQVLAALWDAGRPVSSAELLASLEEDVALTTLLTVLARLTDKKLVERETGQGRGLLFRASRSREEYAAEQLLKIVEGTDNPAMAFAHFAKGLDAKTLAALRETLG